MAQGLKDTIAFLLFGLLFTAVFSSIARAESVTQIQTVQSISRQEFWGWSIENSALKISTAARTTEPYNLYGAYEFVPTFKNRKLDLSGSLRIWYAREYQYQREDGSNGGFENPLLTLNKIWGSADKPVSDWVDGVALAVVSSIGVGNESRRRTFQWSLGPSLTLVKKASSISTQLGIGYRRRFFEYETRANGVVNLPDALVTRIELGLALTEKLSVAAVLIYDYSISFQGVAHPSQTTDISAEYSFTKTFDVSAGLSTLRGTMNPDMKSESIRFVGDDATEFHIDLNWKI